VTRNSAEPVIVSTSHAHAATARRLGILAVAAAAVSFASVPLLAKQAYAHDIDPFALVAWRFVLGALMLWVVVGIRIARGLQTLPPRRDVFRLLFLGAVVLSGEVLLFFLALERIGVGLDEVLLYLYPVWVVVIAAVVLRVAVSRAVVVCSVIAVVGAALTAGGAVRGGADLLSVVMALVASVGFATYVVLSGRWVSKAGSLITTALTVSGTAIAFALLALVSGARGPHDMTGWISAFAMALIGTGLAFGLLTFGLHRLPSPDVAVIATIEPAVAVVLGVVLLGESVGVVQLVGVVLILGSVAVLMRQEAKVDLIDPVTAHE